MAFTAKDGSRHTNIDSMKRANAVHAAKAPKPGGKAQLMDADGDYDDDQAPELGKEDPHQVVAEHGKAHQVTVEHDHEAGRHHVSSQHEDGYQHESEHESAPEAHEHGKCLAGACEHAGDM